MEPLYPNCDCSVWLRSCEEEIINKIHGKITGNIPKWLNGSLIRNGPGLLKIGKHEFGHLFDEPSLLHRFEISNGAVTYQCRFLQSDIFKKHMAAKRIVLTEFGTKSVYDPCNSIFNRVATIFRPSKLMSDNNMISVYPFSDDLYTFGEGCIIHKIDTNTLETKEKVNLNENVGIINHTSHPHIDQQGNVFNLGITVGVTGPMHKIVCFPYTSECNSKQMFNEAFVVASMPSRWKFHPSYMHTFGITPNYFIIVEQPLSLSPINLLKCRIKNEPLFGALKFYREEYTQINLINRKTGKCTYKFQASSFFFLHIINAYEKDDYVVVDICCYKDPSMIECMYIDALKNMQQNPNYASMFRGKSLRFILPLTKKGEYGLVKFVNSNAIATILTNGMVYVSPEILCDVGCETPRIHYDKYVGKEYRYFYAISSDVDSYNPGLIIKVDTKSKTYITWCETDCYPSEPVFVPTENSSNEDGGVLLSALVWGKEDHKVGLLILNAQDLVEIGRVVFNTNTAVPKCLHGWYFPQKTNVKL